MYKIFGQYTFFVIMCLSISTACLLYNIDQTYYIGLGLFFLITLVSVVFAFLGLRTIFVKNSSSGGNVDDIEIKQNHHYSNHRFPMLYFISRKKTFEVIRKLQFVNSCLYHFGNENDSAINKLCGFSLGMFSSPLKNSFRFGWNNVKNNLQMSIYAFYHIDGKMNSNFIMDIDLNNYYYYHIIKTENNVSFKIYDNTSTNLVGEFNLPYTMKHSFDFGWKLFPYFGGVKKAPQDMLWYV